MTELRIQIWQHALDAASADRMIRVGIHYHAPRTNHSCITRNANFCGQHMRCNVDTPEFKNQTAAAVCMLQAHFAVSHGPRGRSNFADSFNYSSIFPLTLACHESRDVFHEKYPKVMRVLSGGWHPSSHQWHPDLHSRLVRCNPASDVLLTLPIRHS
jgi:hypothetical protein